MRTSYENDDVILLLKDMTGLVKPASMEERKNRVEHGEYVRSIIIDEYEMTKEYTDIVYSYIDEFSFNMAKYIGVLAERIYKRKGKEVVLVDIVRAGIPVGILIKRYLKKYYSIDVPHYGISLVKGVDKGAMAFILSKHQAKDIQFIDGWTGKGTVAAEIYNSVKQTYSEVDPNIAVLSDCAGICDFGYFATSEDIYIPYSPLNASITGLVSITVLNENYSKDCDFHAAIYLEELESIDKSREFIELVSSQFHKIDSVKTNSFILYNGEINRISKRLGKDIKLLNPGINEAARAILRRKLEKLIVRNKNDRELQCLIKLAEYKNIPVIQDEKLVNYKAVSVACDDYIR